MNLKTYKKKNLAVEKVRRYLEPGPIVLVSSRYKDEFDIMTMGWHTVLEFSPSLVGCMITNSNRSFDLIRKSRECVINVPEVHLAKKVVGIGNTSGRDVDKFAEFELTAVPAKKVDAPLIKECYANFECRVVNTQLVKRYCFFVLEVVRAQVAVTPKRPRTMHYRGDGEFMISGGAMNLRRLFKTGML